MEKHKFWMNIEVATWLNVEFEVEAESLEQAQKEVLAHYYEGGATELQNRYWCKQYLNNDGVDRTGYSELGTGDYDCETTIARELSDGTIERMEE